MSDLLRLDQKSGGSIPSSAGHWQPSKTTILFFPSMSLFLGRSIKNLSRCSSRNSLTLTAKGLASSFREYVEHFKESVFQFPELLGHTPTIMELSLHLHSLFEQLDLVSAIVTQVLPFFLFSSSFSLCLKSLSFFLLSFFLTPSLLTWM